jgi:ACT domain-containing protein
MIKLEVKLPDRPGSLIELIKPISENGGNIYGVLHYHDKKVNDLIPVIITFDLNPDIIDLSLNNIKKKLKEKNIQIESIDLDSEERNIVVIMTGHVFDTDILDTIKRLASKDVIVSELQAKFTEVNQISNVKLRMNFPDTMAKNEIIEELEQICKEKNLFLISS